MVYGQFDGCECCEGAVAPGSCSCQLTVPLWMKSLSDEKWDFARLTYNNDFLYLNSAANNNLAYVEQVTDQLVIGNKYTLEVPYSASQWDYNLWVDIDGHRAFSSTGITWTWADTTFDNDFFESSSPLTFIAEDTTHTIQVGFTTATSISDPEFPRITGPINSGNAIKEICLCAACEIAQEGSCEITFSLAGDPSGDIDRIEWEVVFCTYLSNGNLACGENQGGFTSRTGTGTTFNFEVLLGEPTGTYQVTAIVYDSNDNIICTARKQFLAGYCGDCCSLGVPEEVQITYSGLDIYDPGNTALSWETYPALQTLREGGTAIASFVATDPTWAFAGERFMYLSPEIYNFIWRDADLKYRRAWVLFRATINCALTGINGPIAQLLFATSNHAFDSEEQVPEGNYVDEYLTENNLGVPSVPGELQALNCLLNSSPASNGSNCIGITGSRTYSSVFSVGAWNQGTFSAVTQ